MFLVVLSVLLALKGANGETCICPMMYDPVCGKDGQTYPSLCDLKCKGVEEAYKGVCGVHQQHDSSSGGGDGEPCLCPRIYKPVCGTDGTTYPNICDMKCNGVQEAYSGRCGVPQPRDTYAGQGSDGSGGARVTVHGLLVIVLVLLVYARW